MIFLTSLKYAIQNLIKFTPLTAHTKIYENITIYVRETHLYSIKSKIFQAFQNDMQRKLHSSMMYHLGNITENIWFQLLKIIVPKQTSLFNYQTLFAFNESLKLNTNESTNVWYNSPPPAYITSKTISKLYTLNCQTLFWHLLVLIC